LAQKLRQRGYQAWALQDGYDAWKAAGLPLEQKSKAA
jgi:rhodanese-related sulfurtransferase